MRIVLSKSQWEVIGHKAGWIKIAKFGDQVKKLYLQQGISPENIDFYLSKFDIIRKRRDKELFDDIVNVTISKDKRQDISQYRNFKDLELVVDYVLGKKSVSAPLRGKVEDKDIKPIYEDDNVEIYRGTSPMECAKIRNIYGSADEFTWCVARNNGNMYNSYRYMGGESTFYFIKNKKDNNGDYHFCVLQVNNNGEYILTSKNNDGDNNMDWEEVVKRVPSINDLQSLFINIPLTNEEKAKYNAMKEIRFVEDFEKLSFEDKQFYVDVLPARINTEKFLVLPDELKNRYIGFGIGLSNEEYDSIKNNPKLMKRYKEITERVIFYGNITESQEQVFDVENNPKSMEIITDAIKKRHQHSIPCFAHQWCIDQLYSGTAPQEWIDCITENIQQGIEPPDFAYKWCHDKLQSGEVPKEWLDAIFKSILDFQLNGNDENSLIFADNWCQKNLESGNMYQEWVQAISKCIELHGTPPEWAEHWAYTQLESGNFPPEWVTGITKYIRNEFHAPGFAEDWCKNQLSSGHAPTEWIQYITKHIKQNGYPPYFGEEWCNNQMDSDNVPQEWIDIIASKINATGFSPNFAYKWCIKQLNSGNPPQKIKDAILQFTKRIGSPPAFAAGWYYQFNKKFFNLKSKNNKRKLS